LITELSDIQLSRTAIGLYIKCFELKYGKSVQRSINFNGIIGLLVMNSPDLQVGGKKGRRKVWAQID
jgi:hypothetical protein